MISEELFSEILEVKAFGVREINGIVYYQTDFYDDGYRYFQDRKINIHELAHLCKEWAKHKGYQLLSGVNNMSDYILYVYYCNNYPEHDKVLYGLSEPEAIFKACQWVKDRR